MVIKSYRKYLLGLLLLAPVSAFAVYDVLNQAVRGPFGWGAHAGLGYLAYKGYEVYTADCEQQSFTIAGQEISKDNLIVLSAAAFGGAALYHSAMLWQFCEFGLQLRTMKGQNTSTNNPVLRKKWAGLGSAFKLKQKFDESSSTNKETIKKQFLIDMGLAESASLVEATRKIDGALEQLEKRLKMYAEYTNIVDLIAQKMLYNNNPGTQGLLDDDVLIDQEIEKEEIEKEYLSNWWITNSLSIGFYSKDNWYIRLPWLYTAMYNIASCCAIETLKQYAMLKAVRHILQQYIPQQGRFNRGSAFDSNC